MPDNRSLDEFLAGEAEAEDAPADRVEEASSPVEDASEPAEEATPEPDADSEESESHSDDTDEAAEDEPVEPMAVTVAWSAEGGVCEACGSTVEERWRDGDAMVCGDCKAW